MGALLIELLAFKNNYGKPSFIVVRIKNFLTHICDYVLKIIRYDEKKVICK